MLALAFLIMIGVMLVAEGIGHRTSSAATSTSPWPSRCSSRCSTSADARALIYNTLGAFPENPPQFVSHRYRAGDPEEWFADSGLRPDTQHLITRMIYRRGNYLAFSDLLAVAARLPDAAERWRLCKTLSRRSTLFVSLHLDAESDLPALTRYWGRGGRAKDVGALLASVAQQPGGSVLDIAHLLPRGVRSLLYTFPRPLEQAAGRVRDCHWTSLSFFQWTPDDRFLDGQEVARAFAEDYQVVEGPPVLGDIVGLVGPDRGMVHSCVYVAADIVFTKNGNSWDMPWVLSTLEDVQSLYAATAQTPLSTVFLRGRSDGGEGVGP
jgi:hypothetical protein